MKRSKLLFLLVLIILIGAYAAYRYTYQPHDKTESQEAAFSGSAEDFIQEVANNAEKWQNAIIQIEGSVSEISTADFVLNNAIFCQPESSDMELNFEKNDRIMIKGRFIGYDDLLEEIKMDKCITIN